MAVRWFEEHTVSIALLVVKQQYFRMKIRLIKMDFTSVNDVQSSSLHQQLIVKDQSF